MDPIPWEGSVKRILEEVFSPRCWEVLVLHDASGEEGTALCIRDQSIAGSIFRPSCTGREILRIDW